MCHSIVLLLLLFHLLLISGDEERRISNSHRSERKRRHNTNNHVNPNSERNVSNERIRKVRHVHGCKSEFLGYHPSVYESSWADNIEERQIAVCNQLHREIPQQIVWFGLTQGYHERNEVNASDPELEKIFSFFEYSMKCRGQRHSHVVHELIEPLAGHIRDHRTLCGMYKATVPQLLESKTGSSLDRRFILLGGSSTLPTVFNVVNNPRKSNGVILEDSSQSSKRSIGKPTILVLDLGASLYHDSQAWFMRNYLSKGFQLGRLVLWEYSTVPPERIFREVPLDIVSNYQYFNLPVTSDWGKNMHPWRILRELAPLYDYVAVKLDIDTPDLENELISQLINDPFLLSTVDEMFFEHHINNNETAKYWREGRDKDKTLADTYRLFTDLRNAGVRMHGWP